MSTEKEMGLSALRQQFLSQQRFAPAGDLENEYSDFNQQIADAFMGWGFAWSAEFWMKISDYVKLIKLATEEVEGELFIVLFPVRQQVEAKILRNEPQEHFKRIMHETGVRHLDLLPALRENFQSDPYKAYYDHCHFTPAGNQFVGKKIAEFLAKNVAFEN